MVFCHCDKIPKQSTYKDERLASLSPQLKVSVMAIALGLVTGPNIMVGTNVGASCSPPGSQEASGTVSEVPDLL